MYQLMSFLFLRSISYHFLLMKNKTLSSSAVLSRFSILINYYTSIINRATSFILLKSAMDNIHRVAVSIQSQSDDRRCRCGDDGRNGRIAILIVVVVAANID